MVRSNHEHLKELSLAGKKVLVILTQRQSLIRWLDTDGCEFKSLANGVNRELVLVTDLHSVDTLFNAILDEELPGVRIFFVTSDEAADSPVAAWRGGQGWEELPLHETSARDLEQVLADFQEAYRDLPV